MPLHETQLSTHRAVYNRNQDPPPQPPPPTDVVEGVCHLPLMPAQVIAKRLATNKNSKAEGIVCWLQGRTHRRDQIQCTSTSGKGTYPVNSLYKERGLCIETKKGAFGAQPSDLGYQPSGCYREVVSIQRSESIAKRAFGTRSSGLYREVVSVQRFESIALGSDQVVLIGEVVLIQL